MSVTPTTQAVNVQATQTGTPGLSSLDCRLRRSNVNATRRRARCTAGAERGGASCLMNAINRGKVSRYS